MNAPEGKLIRFGKAALELFGAESIRERRAMEALIRHKRLTPVYVGRRIFFRRSEIDALVNGASATTSTSQQERRS